MSKWMTFVLSGGRTASGVPLLSSEALEDTYEDNLGLGTGNGKNKSSSVQAEQSLDSDSLDLHWTYNLGWIKDYYKGIIIYTVAYTRLHRMLFAWHECPLHHTMTIQY